MDYHFTNEEAFLEQAFSGQFFEWAKVFDHYYGTPRGPVEDALDDGRDVVFDIDWQGARKLTEQAADDVVRIFILPPSLTLLRERLKKRAQDSDEIINGRMERAKSEIAHWSEYDYVVVNDDFARALEKLNQILHAERLRRTRHQWLDGFVGELMEE